MSKNKWYIKIWKEGGSFVDMWSVNHFFLGMILASAFLNLQLTYLASLKISFIIMVLWEIWETCRNMRESVRNRIGDIILGLLGFLFLHSLTNFNLSELNLFIFSTIFYVSFQLWGYLGCKILKKRFI